MAEFDFSTLKPRSGQRNLGQDPAGFDIDLDRPLISNPDGSFSTERTITVEGRELGLDDNRWYNIPSIIEGRETRDQGEAVSHAKGQLDQGWTFPNFDTEPEASRQAPLRSQRIDELRQPGRDMGQQTNGFDTTTMRARPVDTDDDNRSGWAIQTMKTGAAGVGQMVLNTAKFIWETPSGAARYSKAASESWRQILPAWTDPFAFPAEVFRIVDEGLELGDYRVAGTGDIAENIGDAIDILPEISPTFARLGMKSEEAAEATAALLEGRTDLLKGVATDPEAWAGFIGNALPTLYMAWKSGGSLSFIGWLEAMDAAENVEQYEEMTGEEISHAQFVMSTALVGATNAFLERAGLDAILGKFSKGAGGVIGGFVVGATSEGGTELLQEIVQNVAGLGYDEELRDQATAAIDEGEWLPFLTSMTEGALPALMGGAGLGGPAGSLGANASSMAERHGAIQDKENTRREGRPSLLPDLGGREHYTEDEVSELGLEKVEVTQELLERVGEGAPLTDNEMYTLTTDEDRLGRFIGEAGSERVMLLANGMEQLASLQKEAAPEQIEDITMEGEEVTTELRYDLETIKEAVSPSETFVAETTKTKESRKSIRARLRRAVRRTETDPTDEQIEAGNYRKGHIRVQALPISIETPKGVTRSGTDRTGRKWSFKLKDNYGYITGTKGKDKDHLDVFVGQYPESDTVVVINQKKNALDDLSESNFDEHKIMIGYRTTQEAVDAYNRNYDDGGALKGSAVRMSMSELKEWMEKGDTTKIAKPIREKVYRGAKVSGRKLGLSEDEFSTDLQFVSTRLRKRETIEAQTVSKADVLEGETMWYDRAGLNEAVKEARAQGKKAVRINQGAVEGTRLLILDRTIFDDTSEVKIAPRPIRRRKTNEGKGMQVFQVQNALRPFYRMFRTAPPVRVVEAIEDLPMDVQNQLREQGDEEVTNGVYVQDALTDTVYLIANNTTDAQEAIETMIHEIIGHFGIHQVIPAHVFGDVMDKVAKSFPAEVRDAAMRNGLDFTDAQERRIAAEEFIAYMSQRMVRNESVPAKVVTYIRELVQAIRARLRAAFGKESLYTDAQIWSMLGQATDYVQKAGGLKRDQQRGLRRHLSNPTYYSQMFKIINDDQAKNMSPAKWKELVRSHIAKGRIKQVEVDWMGFEAWIDDLTWNDVAALTWKSEDLLPREVQVLKERKIVAEAVMERYIDSKKISEKNLGAHYQQAAETPDTDEVNAAEKEIREIEQELERLGKTKPAKITKEAVMRFIQTNGTDVSVSNPGQDMDEMPQFDENYPDETEEPDEDDFYESEMWQQVHSSYWDEHLAQALSDVYAEHDWTPDLDTELGITNEEKKWAKENDIDPTDMDEEQRNEARGWDGTTMERMESDANDVATETIEADHYQEVHDEWFDKNTKKTWYSGNIYVSTDSDGDFIVEDTEGGGQIGNYHSTMDEVNEAIEEHFQGEGSQRWKEITLPGGRDYENLLFKWENVQDEEIFQETAHWPDQDWNYFAHARFDVRSDLDGEDAILVDEMQSDWHQEVRDRIEALLTDIHDEHGWDADWWQGTGPYGGADYDGTPLDQMYQEARDQAITTSGEAGQLEKRMRDHFEREYGKDGALRDQSLKLMQAWKIPYDPTMIDKIGSMAAGSWQGTGAVTMNDFAKQYASNVAGLWGRFNRAGVTWKGRELYTAHGWVHDPSLEPAPVDSPEMNHFAHWIHGENWDGTEHPAIMQEATDWLKAMPQLAELEAGAVNPLSAEGVRLEQTEERFFTRDAVTLQLTAQSEEGFDTAPKEWAEYIEDQTKLNSQYYLSNDSPITVMQYDSLAPAVARVLTTTPDEQAKMAGGALRTRIKAFMLDFKENLSKVSRAKNAVTLAPFERTWQTVVMKMMIREAVKRGHKRIFFQTGDVHGVRWGGSTIVDQVWFKKGITEAPGDSIDTKTPDMFTGDIRTDGKKHSVEWVEISAEGHGPTRVMMQKLHTIIGKEAAAVIMADKSLDGTVRSEDVDNVIRYATNKRMSGGREVYNSITVFQFNKFLKPFKAKVKLGAFKPEGSAQSYTEKGANLSALAFKSMWEGVHVDQMTSEEVENVFGSVSSGVEAIISRKGREAIAKAGEEVRTSEDVYQAGTKAIRLSGLWGFRDRNGDMMPNESLDTIEGDLQDRLKNMRAEEVTNNFAVQAWEIEITPKLEEAVNGTGFSLFSKKPRPQEQDIFQIIDGHTGEQVGKNYQGKNARQRARNRVDKLDNEYGAYRYRLKDATGRVRYSKKMRTGRPKIDAALRSLETKVGPPKSRSIEKIQQRYREVIAIDNKGRKIEQGLVDQFAGIKYAIREAYGYDLPAEISGYKQAHFTTSGDSQMYAFLMHGIPIWKDGVTQIKEGSKGLLEVLEPVANHIDEWGRYMAAMRAKRLLTEDRENLITEEEVEGMEELGEMMPEFKTVAAEFAQWKSEFLDWAQETGIINKDTRPLWDHADYVPFYRIKADELGGSFSRRAGQGVAGIANQINPIKRLRGGQDKLGDIMENILINFSHLASTAMKNQATRLTVENLEGTGLISAATGAQFMQESVIAEADLKKKLKAAGIDVASMPTTALNAMRKMWTINPPEGDNVISVLVNGKKKYYNVHEETLLRSLNAINIQKFNELAWRLGLWLPRKAKRLLTTMITLDPGFMVANWFRDIAMAFTNSRHSKFPDPRGAFIGAYKAKVQSKEMVSMMAAGGAFYQGYVNAMDPGATVHALKRAMRKTGVRNRVLDAPWKFLDLYRDIGAAAENANRISQGYIPAIKAGAGTAEAVWESKDLMNFAKHGDWGAIQFLIQTVPFLNARIQGLVRYGQRFKEAPGITFTKSFLYTMAVLAIYLSNRDDERYKELPEEEKDMYVHFWLNGHHWRLPKAFEVGMIFGTAPERMIEYWTSNEDDAGKLALNRLKFVFDEVFMMIDPSTIIPMPQLIKPFYEAANNWNGFFQASIVPEYMQDIAHVKPDMVYRASTSPAMRELARAMPRFMPHTMRNPMLLQHLVRGYFGTLGGHAMLMTDALVRSRFDYAPAPELRWSQFPAVGRFYRGEDQPNRTNYEEIVYELRNVARGIDRTITQMEREELDDEVEAFRDEPSTYNRRYSNQEVLDASDAIDSNMRTIRSLRGDLNSIWLDENMTPRQKLEAINVIYRDKADEFRDAYRERPGASEPTARTTVQPRVGTLALLEDLDGRDQRDTVAFLEEHGLIDLAALVGELPSRPRSAFRDLMGLNR